MLRFSICLTFESLEWDTLGDTKKVNDQEVRQEVLSGYNVELLVIDANKKPYTKRLVGGTRKCEWHRKCKIGGNRQVEEPIVSKGEKHTIPVVHCLSTGTRICEYIMRRIYYLWNMEQKKKLIIGSRPTEMG